MPKKLTTEFVKSQFEKDGYIPKFTEYINNKQKLDYICDKGHQHFITWSDFNNGKRCPSCAGNIKLTNEFVETSLEKENYILTSEYINANTKFDFICPNGHKHSMTWADWSQEVRCGRCKGNIEVTYEDVEKSFITDEYYLISDQYIDSQTPLISICPNGHEYKVSWNNWSRGRRCPKCSNNGTSKFEQEVKQFIIDQDIDIIENDRTTILNPNTNFFLELDILFPCKTKAIECNGIYWHDRPDAIIRDIIKQEQCKEKGIKLFTLTDEEWNFNREDCKDKIINFVL